MEPYISIEQAIRLLQQGNVVALPTETVYGLAADATNDTAIALIYKTKNRPAFNPLIIHVSTLEQAEPLAHVDKRAKQLAQAFWPGPLTIILPLTPQSPISKLATAGLSSVAIRIPAHPIMQAVINGLRKPIAAPSANPSLSISPTSAEHVVRGFQGKVPLVDGGPCVTGIESTIVDLSTTTPTLLRPGPISAEQIEEIIGAISTERPQHIKGPGQLARHYAPKTAVRLNAMVVEGDEGLIAFGPNVPKGAFITANLSPRGNLAEAAANLFRILHNMDAQPIKGIAVMPIPNEGLGIAINDRLTRAAAKE